MITAHDNPRLMKEDNPMIDFEKCLGGEEQVKLCLENFVELNDGDNSQEMIADGIISNLIKMHKIPRRILVLALKVGSGHIQQIRDGKSKVFDHVHLNGNQVR